MKIFNRLKIFAFLALPIGLGGAMWSAARERERRVATLELLERLTTFGPPNQRIRIDDLLDRGADINGADEQGRTLLFHAIERGDADYLVRPLLDRGANVNTRVNDGISPRATPLFLATTMAKVEVVRLLLAHGARVNLDVAPSPFHGTVLMWLEYDIQNQQEHYGRLGTPHQYREILALLRAANEEENRVVS